MQHNKVTPEWVVLAAITCYYRSLISRLPHRPHSPHIPHIPHNPRCDNCQDASG